MLNSDLIKISKLVLPLVDLAEQFKRDELDNEFMRFMSYGTTGRTDLYELLWLTRESFDDFSIPVCDNITTGYPRSDDSVGLETIEDKMIHEFLHSDFFLDRLHELFHSQTCIWNISLRGNLIFSHGEIVFPCYDKMVIKDVTYVPRSHAPIKIS